MPKLTKVKASRSAVNGRFVKKSYVKKNKRTTVVETIKRVFKRNKKGRFKK